MNLAKVLVTMTAAVGISAAANADLSYTFDTDLEGFQNASHQTTAPVGWPTLPAILQSHTAGGWQMMLTKEFSWGTGGGSANQQLAMQAAANQGDNSHLAFDVMADGTSFGTTNGAWYNFWIAGNSDGATGWTQSKLIDSWQNAGQSDLRTWHFDMPFSALGWQPGDSWFQIFTGANSDTAVPVNFYMDNFKVYTVPEPSVLALAGLGAAFLLRLRRK